MPRKPPRRQGQAPTSSAKRGPRSAGTEELERALDALLEEGIGSYDDTTDDGRRRMMELNAGFAAGEALLHRLRERGAPTGARRVEALSAVIRYILHWAGEEREIDEPRETLTAMRTARRALERAARPGGATSAERRRRGGAA